MKILTGLSAPLTDIDGVRPLAPAGEALTLRSAIVQCIGRAQSPDPVHMMALALELHKLKKDTFELEDADFELLKSCVESDRGYTNIIRAPLAQCFTDAETPLSPEEKTGKK